MTIEDMGQIMDVLNVFYPAFYAKQTDDDKYKASVLWASLFEPYPVELVLAAVKGFIGTDTKGFPPVPGQIMEKIRTQTAPEEMTALEAWGLVAKATRNGYYGYLKEYDKLQPLVQKAVGRPEQLREWAQMDTNTLNSVVASNFQRAYRQHVQRQEEYQKLPGDVRAVVDALAEGFKAKSLTDGEE